MADVSGISGTVSDGLLSAIRAAFEGQVNATNEEKDGWLEIVKVKENYYGRVIAWDKTEKRKVYRGHKGTLEKCRATYSGSVARWERNRRRS